MHFHSLEFVFVFLPICLVGLVLLQPRGLGNYWLLLVSIFSYAYADLRFLPILAGSIAANYCFSSLLDRSPERSKAIMWAALAFNILLLGLFKYTNFMLENVSAILGRSLPPWHVFFPLGISFFTLQQIMFVMDRYEKLVPHPRLPTYTLFVSFFPSIAAGPLLRYKPVAVDLESLSWNWDWVAKGLYIFILGLGKKSILADSFGQWADAGFASPQTLTAAGAWLSSLSYTLQLYFDFSGYSDMALGIALMLNVRIPQNFDSPLRARSLIEFWQRWHISLSRFITTYLYTPIVRSFRKITLAKAMTATLVAMTIAGLWHGPSWNFVLFGTAHGIGLVVNNLWRKAKIRMPGFVSVAITFLFLNCAFVVFRANDIRSAMQILRSMWMPSGFHDQNFTAFAAINVMDKGFTGVVMLAGLLIVGLKVNSRSEQAEFEPTWTRLVFSVGLAALSLLFLNSVVSKEFLYFDF